MDPFCNSGMKLHILLRVLCEVKTVVKFKGCLRLDFPYYGYAPLKSCFRVEVSFALVLCSTPSFETIYFL